MSHSAYLWIANALVWIGVLGYIGFLARDTRRLWRRLDQLEPSVQEQTDRGDT
jgi:CcmD family protein